jgi:hypothetical protein
MLKLARNQLAKHRQFIWKNFGGEGNDAFVDWGFIEKLFKLQTDEGGLRLANKLTRKCIEFESSKMKVNIAARTLSLSVAKAIAFLRKKGVEEFSGSEATCRFIEIIDQLFDLMNSKDLQNSRW